MTGNGFYNRIESLTPRLQKLAEVYSQNTYQTADDLYQSMIVVLIERQAADPTFAEQSNSYIVDAGRKAICLPAMRRAGVESKHTFEEPVVFDGDADDNFFETVAGPGINPEMAVINLEQALSLAEKIRSLSDREREVLTLTVKGVPAKTIAAGFGISPSAVTIYKNRAVAKLQAAVIQ